MRPTALIATARAILRKRLRISVAIPEAELIQDPITVSLVALVRMRAPMARVSQRQDIYGGQLIARRQFPTASARIING